MGNWIMGFSEGNNLDCLIDVGRSFLIVDLNIPWEENA